MGSSSPKFGMKNKKHSFQTSKITSYLPPPKKNPPPQKKKQKLTSGCTGSYVPTTITTTARLLPSLDIQFFQPLGRVMEERHFRIIESGWWLNQPIWKNMNVKMGSSSPKFEVEIKHIWNHHLGVDKLMGIDFVSPKQKSLNLKNNMDMSKTYQNNFQETGCWTRVLCSVYSSSFNKQFPWSSIPWDMRILTDVLITVPELKVLSLKVIYTWCYPQYIGGDHHSNGTI